MKQTSKNKKKRSELLVLLTGMLALKRYSKIQLGISGGVPAAFSYGSPMPACMSAIQPSQRGSTAQLQKHVAVAEAVQPALVIVVYLKSLSNLDDIMCLWLP